MDQESEMLGILFRDKSLSKVGGSVQIAITANKTDEKRNRSFEIIVPANVKHPERFKEIREHIPFSIKTGSRSKHTGLRTWWDEEVLERS